MALVNLRAAGFNLAMIGVVGFSLPACTTTSQQNHQRPEWPTVSFSQQTIVTGLARHQTVLTGFLLGGPHAEVVVVHVDDNRDRHLRIYSMDSGNWILVRETELSSEVLFVDRLRAKDQDRLILFEPGQFQWLDPETGKTFPLVSMTSPFKAPKDSRVPHLDITRDLNGDGREDIIMPDLDGFWISLQNEDGTLGMARKRGPADPHLDDIAWEDKKPYREVGITARTIPDYLSRVHLMDWNQDERKDLVFWNRDHFVVHYQDAQGQFESTDRTFPAVVPFDTDGPHTLAFGFHDESTFALLCGCRKKTRRSMLHSVRDVNGDGIADLMVQSIEGRSLLKLRSRYHAHHGMATTAGLAFTTEPDATVQPKGRPGEPLGYAVQQLEDVDGDGQLDVMLQIVKTGFGGMIRALAANSIALDLQVFRMDGSRYPDHPDITRKIRPNLDFWGPRIPFFPSVLLADVTGDGRMDLVVGENWEALNVYVGVPAPELFSQEPQEMTVAMPSHEKNLRAVDLNRDAKKDLLIHHPSSREPNKVILLMAR